MTILGLILAMCMQVTSNPPVSCNWNGIIAAGGGIGRLVSCLDQLTKDEKKVCDKEHGASVRVRTQMRMHERLAANDTLLRHQP